MVLSAWISNHELASVGSSEFLLAAASTGRLEQASAGQTAADDEGAAGLDELAAGQRRAVDIASVRLTVAMTYLASCHEGRRALHRVEDGRVAAAAAQVRRGTAHEGVLDLGHRRRRRLVEQLGGLDHHAVLAEPALRHLLVDPRLLHRVQRPIDLGQRQSPLVGPPRRQSLQGGDLFAGDAAHRQHARARFLAIHQHGTGPALRQSTAELRTAQLEVIPQHVEQRRVSGHLDLATRAIDGHRDAWHQRFLLNMSRRERCLIITLTVCRKRFSGGSGLPRLPNSRRPRHSVDRDHPGVGYPGQVIWMIGTRTGRPRAARQPEELVMVPLVDPVMTRRRFGAAAGCALASIVFRDANAAATPARDPSDGRLTARPRANARRALS